MRESYHQVATRLIPLCDSPPEMLLAVHLAVLDQFDGWWLLGQHPVGSYRLDFAYLPADMDVPGIAIEVDGKWHDETTSQRVHDRKRDRYLQDQGWIVRHYEAAEVFRDPGRVAAEIHAIVAKHVEKHDSGEPQEELDKYAAIRWHAENSECPEARAANRRKLAAAEAQDEARELYAQIERGDIDSDDDDALRRIQELALRRRRVA